MNRLLRLIPGLALSWACADAGSDPFSGSFGGRVGASPEAISARGGASSGGSGATLADYPNPEAVRALLVRANARFMSEWPDPTAMVDVSLASNGWARATYYEGLMALHAVWPDAALYAYAVNWGTRNAWGLQRGATGVFAEDQCAGQTYIELYALDPQPERIAAIATSLDQMLASNVVSNWYFIDAIQMSMPVLAKFGALKNDPRYFEKMAVLYQYARDAAGGGDQPGDAPGPLYDARRHLWWRDRDFDPPFATANGKNCYWSRGNGWVLAGLARVLDTLPSIDPHRELYIRDFQDMAVALAAVQRSDGFWNPNLADADDFGGPELSGTSLFVYGLAWGVRRGLLDEALFKPVIVKGWHAMASAVHADGALGYVQGSGKQPKDGQPVTYDSVPDLDDFGLGCFLLAGSEVARLGR